MSERIKVKVQQMLVDHPEIEGPLRTYVPEVFNEETLFVTPGAIFMRKGFQHNIYTLSYCTTNGFRIVNIKDNKGWGKWYPASERLKDVGLTKWDFISLLKLSNVKLESIKFVGTHHFDDIYNKLFY